MIKSAREIQWNDIFNKKSINIFNKKTEDCNQFQIELYYIGASMHYDPKCPEGHQACKTCISKACTVKNPFICFECEKNRHSSSCNIITYKNLIKEFRKRQGIYTQEMFNFQEKVETVFETMIKRLKAEFLEFRERFQHHQIIPPIESIYVKIKQGKENQLNANYLAEVIDRKYFGGKPVLKDEMTMFTMKRSLLNMFEEIIKKLRCYYSLDMNLGYEQGPSLEYSQNPIKHIMRKYVKPKKQVSGLFNPYFRQFEELLAKPIYNLQLLYKATDYNFDSKVFHDECDGITNTVTIAKTEYDKIVIGYCSLAWQSPEQWVYRSDHKSECFLMSVHEYFKNCKFTTHKKKFAIGMHKEYGPSFGDDFVIYNKANHSKNCWSNFPDVYTCKQRLFPHNQSTIMQFVGVKDHYEKFNLTEWEVYKVSYGPDDEVESKQMRQYRMIGS